MKNYGSPDKKPQGLAPKTLFWIGGPAHGRQMPMLSAVELLSFYDGHAVFIIRDPPRAAMIYAPIGPCALAQLALFMGRVKDDEKLP